MARRKLWLSSQYLDLLAVTSDRLKILWREYESDHPVEGDRQWPGGDEGLYGIVQNDVGCIDGGGDCDIASGTGLTVDSVTVGCTDVVIRYAELDADGNPEETGTADVIAKAVYLYGTTTPTNLCACEPYLQAGNFVPLKFINGRLCVDLAFVLATEDCS